MIVYASIYGHTENAANVLASKLVERGMSNISMFDVSKTHISYLISETFKLSHIVLASVTYNLGIYPPMHNYLMDMKALNVQNRTVALVENGSWAPKSGELMKEFLDEMKLMTVLNEQVSLVSELNENSIVEMDVLADAIIESINE